MKRLSGSSNRPEKTSWLFGLWGWQWGERSGHLRYIRYSMERIWREAENWGEVVYGVAQSLVTTEVTSSSSGRNQG